MSDATDTTATTTVTYVATPAPAPAAAPRPGWQTSEFILSSIAKLLSILLMSGVIGTGTTAERIAGMAAMVLTSLGYTVSRGMVKAAGILLLFGLIGAQPACATLSKDATAAKVAIVECAKERAEPILTLVAKLAVKAALSAADLGHIDWAPLEGSALVEGKITGGCALKRFVAELHAAPKAETAARGLLAPPDPAAEGDAALARLSAKFGGTVWQ